MTTSRSPQTDKDAARLVVTSAINSFEAAYSDWVDGRRHRVYQETSSDDAKFFIAVAGELLAEVSDLVDDWQRIIDRVSQFEEEVGIAGQPR